MGSSKLVSAAKSGDRLQTLIELRDVLAASISSCKSMRDMASLSKRLIEVLDEIEAVSGDAGQESRQKGGVTKLEVIAGKRAGRRAASSG